MKNVWGMVSKCLRSRPKTEPDHVASVKRKGLTCRSHDVSLQITTLPNLNHQKKTSKIWISDYFATKCEFIISYVYEEYVWGGKPKWLRFNTRHYHFAGIRWNESRRKVTCFCCTSQPYLASGLKPNIWRMNFRMLRIETQSHSISSVLWERMNYESDRSLLWNAFSPCFKVQKRMFNTYKSGDLAPKRSFTIFQG